MDVTEGLLTSHLERVEEAGAVVVEKEFVDRKPQTTYELTPDGRDFFEDQSSRSRPSSTVSRRTESHRTDIDWPSDITG